MYAKLEQLKPEQKNIVYKALTIDPDQLVNRNEQTFQSIEKDPAIAKYEFTYY